jgi:hypothetical protein
VVCRRWVDLAPGRLQPALYHAARSLDQAQAADQVRAGTEAARAAADRALATVVAELGSSHNRVVMSCVLVGALRIPASLPDVLASHALLHAAEGALFREAVMSASEMLGLKVTPIPERELWHLAEAHLGFPPPALEARLRALGQAVGPPWGKDQKLAALAAWIGLATAERRISLPAPAAGC